MFLFIYLYYIYLFYYIFISQEKKYVFLNLTLSVYIAFLLGNISYENTYICTSIHLYYSFIWLIAY